MHADVLDRRRKGINLEQYYGKWPFTRVLGVQEIASVIFSIANFIPHYMYFHSYAALTRGKRCVSRTRNAFRHSRCFSRWCWVLLGFNQVSVLALETSFFKAPHFREELVPALKTSDVVASPFIRTECFSEISRFIPGDKTSCWFAS